LGVVVPLTSVRVLVQTGGKCYKLARIDWWKKDASLYVTPYMPAGGGIAYAGLMRVPEPGERYDVDFTAQLRGQNPKLSLHESGQTHGYLDVDRTPAVKGSPLFNPLGGHIATMVSANVTNQPTVDTPRPAPDTDVLLQLEDGQVAANVALVIYATEEAARNAGASFGFKLSRPSLPQPLVVAVRGRVPEMDGQEGGVLCFGGWGPGNVLAPSAVYVLTAPRDGSQGPGE
jgi:hypothetical protein